MPREGIMRNHRHEEPLFVLVWWRDCMARWRTDAVYIGFSATTGWPACRAARAWRGVMP